MLSLQPMKPTSFSVAFAIVSFAVILLFKSIMFFHSPKETYFLYATFHLPGIFFLDLVVFTLCTMHLSRTMRRCRSVLLITFLPLQTLVATMFFGYFMETRNFMDWFMFEDMNAEMLHSYSIAFRSQLASLATAFSTLIGMQICVAFVTYRTYKAYSTKRYLPVKAGDLSETSSEEEDDAESRVPSPTATRFVSFKMILLLSMLSYVFVIPPFSEMARLSENYLLSPPLTHLFRAVYKTFKVNEELEEDMQDIRVDYSTGDAYPASAEAKIEHVVILHMESLRSDMLDFKPDGHLSKLLLNKYHVEHFDSSFSPFLNKLKHKSYFFPQARTSAGYTIKSLLSSTCSVFALKGSHTEFRRNIYAPCLPQILKNHTNAFFHPADLGFDHLGDLVLHTGYDAIHGRNDLNVPVKDYVNYFGPDDRNMLPRVQQFLDSLAVKSSSPSSATATTTSPFLMGFLTNAGHHHFGLPPGTVKKTYVSNKVINDYLNAVNNVDGFVESFISEFQKRGLLEKTVFAIIGDHGMGLGDHGIIGSGEGGYEESFRVPLLFYSENPTFKKLWVKRVDDVPASNVDILPTVLDFLRVLQPEAGALHEGQSLLRNVSRSRLMYTISNPVSQHSQILLQDGWKLRRDVRSDERMFFDLNEDPLEQNRIFPGKMTGEQKEWVQKAYSKIMALNRDIERKYTPVK
ncbi:alkaline-phosphatase-like protein [Obelidium mucronatum]|nr:alkaline-phosphatase-like protein [Obelidium mucronatum]